MLDIWFPQACSICSKLPHLLCEPCRSTVRLRPRTVSRANLPAGIAVTDYGGSAQDLLHAFKLSGANRLASEMARPMAQQLAAHLSAVPSDAPKRILLIPAPSRKAANRQRGFQPATLLAKEVALRLRASGMQARVETCLGLEASVRDQSLLSASERELNLSGKVTLRPGSLGSTEGWRIVLLDDIVTTGATLRGMYFELLSKGHQPESFLTFAETL